MKHNVFFDNVAKKRIRETQSIYNLLRRAHQNIHGKWMSNAGGGNYLLFSDPNSNIIYKHTPSRDNAGMLKIFRTPSCYSGADVAEYGQPGSNGLKLDAQGRLTINKHGNHRVYGMTDEVFG